MVALFLLPTRMIHPLQVVEIKEAGAAGVLGVIHQARGKAGAHANPAAQLRCIAGQLTSCTSNTNCQISSTAWIRLENQGYLNSFYLHCRIHYLACALMMYDVLSCGLARRSMGEGHL
jgi:hypothetical protein